MTGEPSPDHPAPRMARRPTGRKPRAVCPWCQRVWAVAVPAGGDGSAYVYPYHGPRGDRCQGSRRIVEPKNEVDRG